jgi:hypothetical protein
MAPVEQYRITNVQAEVALARNNAAVDLGRCASAGARQAQLRDRGQG